jgi:hypothetical protein
VRDALLVTRWWIPVGVGVGVVVCAVLLPELAEHSTTITTDFYALIRSALPRITWSLSQRQKLSMIELAGLWR